MHKRVGLSLGRKAKGNTCRGSGFKFLRSDAYMEVSRNPQVCCYLLSIRFAHDFASMSAPTTSNACTTLSSFMRCLQGGTDVAEREQNMLSVLHAQQQYYETRW